LIFEQAFDRKRRIILYGAGKIGQRVAAALRWFGHPAAFFWDRCADLLGNERDGMAVLPPDLSAIPFEERADCLVVVTVFSENVAEQIRQELLLTGYANVLSDKAAIGGLLEAECASRLQAGRFEFRLMRCHICPVVSDVRSRCEIFDRHIRDHFVRGVEARLVPEVVVPSVGVLISNKCTMTCEGCNHLRDHYASDDHRDLAPDQVIEDLRKLLSAVDLVNKLVLVGGEALLHPRVEEIIDRLLMLPKVGILQVITNGTVVPKSRRVFELLASPRIIVEISDYGDHVPEPLRPNVSRFIEQLENHRIQYRRIRTLQWFDFGGFEDRGYTEEEIRRVYRTCCFLSHDLFDGRLYKCSRSAYGTVIGKVPNYPSDYVDIRSLDRQSLRMRLVEFLSLEYVDACRHCNGASAALTMEAGKQIVVVKKGHLRRDGSGLEAVAGVSATRTERRPS
jgi:MoaA/NifB/PqqE/SkfB family radical SAM enzyme